MSVRDWERWQVCPICGEGLPYQNYCNRHGDVSQFRGETLNVVIPEEIKEVEKAKEDVERARQELWKREVSTYLKREKLEEEKGEIRRKKRVEEWERTYGKDTVAIVGHPFRSKKGIHKEDL